MNTTTETASLHDLLSDANVLTSGIPADAFPADEPPTVDELERMAAEAADRDGRRVTVVSIDSAGYMGFLLVADAAGHRISMSDIASVYGGLEVGMAGTAWLDGCGHWNFSRDRTPADDEVDAFIAECEEYERTRPRKSWEPMPEPTPITAKVQQLNPAAWGL